MVKPLTKLRSLEGQLVYVELVDGSHIGHCRLVSVTGGAEGSVWLIDDQADIIIPLAHLTEVGLVTGMKGWAA